MGMEIITGHNNTYPKGGVPCSNDSFVVNESSVLRINTFVKYPAHLKSAKRYKQFYETP